MTTCKPEERLAGSPWTLADAAKFLQVSDRTITTLISKGKLRTILLGRRRLVPDDEIRRVAVEGCK